MSIIKKSLIIFLILESLPFITSFDNIHSENEIDEALKEKLSKGYLITLKPYEMQADSFNYFKTPHYYEDEQPITLEVGFSGNAFKELNIGIDDWFNYIEFYVTPTKYLYYYDETDKKNELEGYSSDKETITNKKYKVDSKIIKSEYLKGGKIKPGEKKTAIFEIWDTDEKPFKENHCYRISVKLVINNGENNIQSFNQILGNPDSYKDIYIIKPRTPIEKMGWLQRKSRKAEKENNYKIALEYGYKVLEIFQTTKVDSRRSYRWEEALRMDVVRLLTKNKDYEKARRLAIDILNPLEEKLIKTKEKLKYLYETDPPIKYKDEIKRYEKIISLLEEEELNKESLLETLNVDRSNISDLREFDERFESIKSNLEVKYNMINGAKFIIEKYERDIKNGKEEMPKYEEEKSKIRDFEIRREKILKKIKELDEQIKK